jgi:DNA-binding transcriptional regulator YbjK
MLACFHLLGHLSSSLAKVQIGPGGDNQSGGRGMAVTSNGRWSSKQSATRAAIREAAARVVAREGLAGCTVRAVALEAGLPKSTVHYLVVDANELVDLAVQTFISRLVDRWRSMTESETDDRQALGLLVRMFLGRGPQSGSLKDPTLWSTYTAHAWKRGANEEILACFAMVSRLFETVLERHGVADPALRASAIHFYLLGAVQRNISEPVPSAHVAFAVSSLSGVALDPASC